LEEVTPQTMQAYCRSWQKACKTTRSLASGIHFGHYIARTFNPTILVVNATLANIPLCTGFTYERWKKGLNVMIKKTAGDLMSKNSKSFSFLRQILMPTTNGLAVQ